MKDYPSFYYYYFAIKVSKINIVYPNNRYLYPNSMTILPLLKELVLYHFAIRCVTNALYKSLLLY